MKLRYFFFALILLSAYIIGIAGATANLSLNPGMDEYVYNISPSSSTYSAIRSGNGLYEYDAEASFYAPRLLASSTSNQFARNYRGALTFNTTPLGSTAYITGATLYLTSISSGTGLGSFSVVLKNGTTTSNTAGNIADYQKYGNTILSSNVSSSVGLASNITFPFTASGISTISKTGWTYIYVMSNWDTDASFTGTWASGAYSGFQFDSVENATTGARPRLEIAYTLPPTTVSFTSNVSSGTSPCGVALTDSSTGDAPTSWNYYGWNVTGNNSEVLLASSQSPAISLTTGNWSIKLKGTNAAGSTNSSTSWVNVSGTAVSPPVASFTLSNTMLRIPMSVTGTDTSTNTPTSWQWSWGDGTANSTTANPTHTYTTRGKFSINMAATNAGGTGVASTSTVLVVGYANE
jgi:PKD repeat protein